MKNAVLIRTARTLTTLVPLVLVSSFLGAQSRAEWGELEAGECVADGVREVFAPIYVYRQQTGGSIVPGSPEELSLEVVCQITPLEIDGIPFEGADRCYETDSGIVGGFGLPDESCVALPPAISHPGTPTYRPPLQAYPSSGPPWGKFKPQGCSDQLPGHRNFYAVVKTKKSQWLTACYGSPASIHGWDFAGPTRCLYLLPLGGWVEAHDAEPYRWGALMAVGEFPIPDSTCP